MAKDYYKILGVEKDASADDIKKSFKKLSMQWHPDRCHDDSKKAEYEEKFKEIAEAYSVLSDPQKRQEYDNPMTGGANFHFGGFGGTNFEDLFSSFGFNFNPFGNMHQGPQVVKGQSLRIVINLTLEELYNGAKKKFKYKRYDKCPTCNGSGKDANTVEETCSHCGGTGQEFKQVGGWQQIRTCPYCGGKGKILKNPCHTCGGEGLVLVENEIEVNIPKGSMDGFQFKLDGKGHAPKGGNGEYGDLLVVVREAEHEYFSRSGNDLYFVIDINPVDAMLGCTKEVTTIDGRKLNTRIQAGVDNQAKIRFANEGMPIFEKPSKKGNMYGIVNIETPKVLNAEEKAILENLKTKPHFRD